MDILKIKNTAINETLEFFKKYESLFESNGFVIFTKNELLDHLDKKHGDYDKVIAKYDKFSTINKNDIEHEIYSKLKEYQNAKDSFIDNTVVNTLNTFNDASIDRMVKDYCTICFWFEFCFEYLKALDKPKTKNQSLLKTQKKQKISAKYHVVSYILEHIANDKVLPIKQMDIESDAKKRPKYKGSPITFRKNFDILKEVSYKNGDLACQLRDDWTSIVLDISICPDTLRPYLERYYPNRRK